MLHNLDNPVLLKFSEGGGWGEKESERMILPRPLAVTDFKKLIKKACVQFSSLVLLFHLHVYFNHSLFVSNNCMVDFINAFLKAKLAKTDVF